VSVYDGVYVALAEALDADLVTADERLGRAIEAHTSVRLIGGPPWGEEV
jgi:predicted nucleic acid-binding protein